MSDSHYEALKKLAPLDLGRGMDNEFAVLGESLDDLLGDAYELLGEMFIETAESTLARWEREYGLYPDSNASIEDRRRSLRARVRDRGGISRTYFSSIGEALGYQIEISESPPMFRAGISKAGDRVYHSSNLWKWVVLVIGVDAAPDLESLFQDLKPPYTSIQFVYS